jgi:O-acetyl-ADP-ribose deacetylase (regulator of RNase III)
MIELIQGDIATVEVDAIVNAANSTLLGGGGVDGAIHSAAGARLLAECVMLGGCGPGDAKITKGHNLFAKHVIHTVGPVWHGGDAGEAGLLASCYRRSLEVAIENGVKSIAFPCISTGVYHFPKDEACEIAICEVKAFLDRDDRIEKVVFVCLEQVDYDLYLSELEDA